jgi:hypothetical protein
MAQNEANAPTDFEAPAPVCVCGLLVVATLTKGGHPHWAIGGMIFAYVLYLAMQYAKHGAGSTRALGVTDSMMMNVRTSRKLRKCIGDPRYLFERCFLFAEGRPDATQCGRWNAARHTWLVVDRAHQ